jgi:hypothetical protein
VADEGEVLREAGCEEGISVTNEEFLGYFAIHCRTERALFSRDQVARLLRLSGDDKPLGNTPNWVSVYADVADPLILKARRRLKFRVIKGGKK